MEEQPEPRSESADLCPCCGRACGGVKVRHVIGCVFLLCAVEWNKYRIAGCPACVRRALKRHLRRNLLTANLLWPFLVLPSVLAAKRGLDEPGPSPEWLKLVDAVDRLKAGIARNAEGAADELPPLPVAPETRHSGGEPFRPSRGPFGKKCFIGLLLWMLLVLPAGSFLYALASYELPWAAVGLLALFVLAALNGGGISVIARSCRCRSPIGLRIAALALGVLVAAVYMYKNTCTQSMAVTLALLPAMVQVIILLVNGNLGAGVAVSGAFGLVRFRSAPGSARDITCIFLAMTLGLATGMGYIGIAVVTGAAMCLLLLVYAALSFGRRPEEEKEPKITIPENLDYTGLFEDLFAEYTRSAELISVRTTGMGSLYNLHYHITLVSADIEKQLIDAIRCRNGNLDTVCGKVPQAKEAL